MPTRLHYTFSWMHRNVRIYFDAGVEGAVQPDVSGSEI